MRIPYHKLQKNRLNFRVLLVIQTSTSVEWCFLFGKNDSWALGPGPLAHAVGPRLWARFWKTLANTTRCYCHKQILVLLLFFAWWCLLQCYLCLCCLVCVVSYRLWWRVFFFCVFCVLGVADCDFVFWIYVCCDITLHIVCGALSAALEAVYMCLV